VFAWCQKLVQYDNVADVYLTLVIGFPDTNISTFFLAGATASCNGDFTSKFSDALQTQKHCDHKFTSRRNAIQCSFRRVC